MILIKSLQKMLKQDLSLQILNSIGQYRKEKIKVIGLMKQELAGKIVKEFRGLRGKIYSYLIDNGSEDRNAKGTKKYAIERKHKFENCKPCLEETELEK